MTNTAKPIALSLDVEELEHQPRAGFHTTARTCTCTVLTCQESLRDPSAATPAKS